MATEEMKDDLVVKELDDGGKEKAIFATFEDFNVKLVVESNFEAFDRLL